MGERHTVTKKNSLSAALSLSWEKAIEEIKLPATEKKWLPRIGERLSGEECLITYIEPTEYRSCPGYAGYPKKGKPFFRVRGFVCKVKFRNVVVVDKTPSGYQKSEKIALEE